MNVEQSSDPHGLRALHACLAYRKSEELPALSAEEPKLQDSVGTCVAAGMCSTFQRSISMGREIETQAGESTSGLEKPRVGDEARILPQGLEEISFWPLLFP